MVGLHFTVGDDDDDVDDDDIIGNCCPGDDNGDDGVGDGFINGGRYTEELNIGHMYGAGVAITQQQLLVVVQTGRRLTNVTGVVIRITVATVLLEYFLQ